MTWLVGKCTAFFFYAVAKVVFLIEFTNLIVNKNLNKNLLGLLILLKNVILVVFPYPIVVISFIISINVNNIRYFKRICRLKVFVTTQSDQIFVMIIEAVAFTNDILSSFCKYVQDKLEKFETEYSNSIQQVVHTTAGTQEVRTIMYANRKCGKLLDFWTVYTLTFKCSMSTDVCRCLSKRSLVGNFTDYLILGNVFALDNMSDGIVKKIFLENSLHQDNFSRDNKMLLVRSASPVNYDM